MKDKSPNIHRMAQNFNRTSQWASCEILLQDKIEKRVKITKKLIKIANFCLEINNFDTAMAIVLGLTSIPILRLKKTWAKIESFPKIQEMYNELLTFIDAENNHKAYRDRLNGSKPPAIPYIGLFLRDFTLLGDGNPDNLKTNDGQEVINIDKRRKIFSIIHDLVKYQHIHYPFIEASKSGHLPQKF